MGKIGKCTGETEAGFLRLKDAVRLEPHKVPAMVSEDREILSATNGIGENVLGYLALENKLEEVKLLRRLGSPIPEFSLWEAIEAGHTDMVILLLELGVEVEIVGCRHSVNNGYGLDDKKRHQIRSYFKQYGYEI